MWQPITALEVKHYIYCMLYILVLVNIRDHLIWVTRPFLLVAMKVFPLSVIYEINRVDYQGERTHPILPGKIFFVKSYLVGLFSSPLTNTVEVRVGSPLIVT